MVYENLILEKTEGLLFIKINRPSALNALNTATLLEVKEAVTQAAVDDETKVLIFTGVGSKSFVAGADIAEMQNMSAMEGRHFAMLGQNVFRLIEKFEKPIIAAVNGFALGGGCELAMCCDIRIASANAKFGQPEVGLGITPGFGGTQRMPRLIAPGMAKQLLFTADTINADEAFRLGLVNQVVSSDQLIPVVIGIAQRIASKAQLAVRLCKVAANEGLQTDIDRGMSLEADAFGLCFSTNDQQEGMTAFLEKRKSIFTGK